MSFLCSPSLNVRVCLNCRKSESDIASRWVHRESNSIYTLNSHKDHRNKFVFALAFFQCIWTIKWTFKKPELTSSSCLTLSSVDGALDTSTRCPCSYLNFSFSASFRISILFVNSRNLSVPSSVITHKLWTIWLAMNWPVTASMSCQSFSRCRCLQKFRTINKPNLSLLK